MRGNTLMPVSFGRDETQLLKMLNEGTKRIYISRSAWGKQKIREEFGKEAVKSVS